jgi:hypothetical protein
MLTELKNVWGGGGNSTENDRQIFDSINLLRKIRGFRDNYVSPIMRQLSKYAYNIYLVLTTLHQMDKGRHYSLLEEPLPTHHSRSSLPLSILHPTPSAGEAAPINNIRTVNNNNKTEDFSKWSKWWVSSLSQLKGGPVFELKSVYLSVQAMVNFSQL